MELIPFSSLVGCSNLVDHTGATNNHEIPQLPTVAHSAFLAAHLSSLACVLPHLKHLHPVMFTLCPFALAPLFCPCPFLCLCFSLCYLRLYATTYSSLSCAPLALATCSLISSFTCSDCLTSSTALSSIKSGIN